MLNIIHISIILISTDTLAPLALIDCEKYPDLLSVVFGEGVTNDAIGLIAFNTILGIGGQNYSITPKTGSLF